MQFSEVIEIDDPLDQAAIDTLGRSLEGDGVAVVQPGDSSRETLLAIAGMLGDVQSHVRSAPDGIAEATAKVTLADDAEWQRHRSEYQAYGTGETPPHTDGAYLDGIIGDGTTTLRIGPPRYLVLHMVHTANNGGTNFVVDGTAVLRDMLADEPELALKLMTPGCVTFCRDDQVAIDQAVFAAAGAGRFSIRFRADAKAFVPAWADDAVARLRDHYTVDPRYRHTVEVADGQILIVDNNRMLHGRTAFSDGATGEGRLLRRVWILDPERCVRLANLRGEVSTSRALDRYTPYGLVPNPLRQGASINCHSGIRLDVESRDLLAHLPPLLPAA